MRYERSSALFRAAFKVLPGGVNSPVRAFKAVGGTPVFVKEAKGAYFLMRTEIVLSTLSPPGARCSLDMLLSRFWKL